MIIILDTSWGLCFCASPSPMLCYAIFCFSDSPYHMLYCHSLCFCASVSLMLPCFPSASLMFSDGPSCFHFSYVSFFSFCFSYVLWCSCGQFLGVARGPLSPNSIWWMGASYLTQKFVIFVRSIFAVYQSNSNCIRLLLLQPLLGVPYLTQKLAKGGPLPDPYGYLEF